MLQPQADSDKNKKRKKRKSKKEKKKKEKRRKKPKICEEEDYDSNDTLILSADESQDFPGPPYPLKRTIANASILYGNNEKQ